MARRAEGRSEVRRAQRRHPSLDESDRRQARPQGRRAGRRAAAVLPELRGRPARPALRVGRAGDRPMNGEPRMVRLAELWERTSARGTRYFSGFMGDAQVLLFDGGEREHPTKPGETVHVWRLMVQERDPARRPQARRPEAEQERELRSRPEPTARSTGTAAPNAPANTGRTN